MHVHDIPTVERTEKIKQEYKQTLQNDKTDIKMIKRLKIVRSIIVNIGVIGITVLSISQGADPNIVGVLSLMIISAYNGLELQDFRALQKAYKEVQEENEEKE
jgi:hypothetical protein